jgi:7,8-dihydropterin-6-yl-methyl-4-(beta-D-ribofuranosyl)aminobenzene 5'-phosphate synthase
MKITIIYDNTAWNPGLTPDWGFACLVETTNHTLLFDTGAKGMILLGNMEKLGILPATVDMVVLSHNHWDHTGGLHDFLSIQPATVVVPAACPVPANATDVVAVKHPTQLGDNLYSTGQLDDFEQSLVIRQDNRTVVVVGCSHPGVGQILKAASRFGKVDTLIGGLHGFNDFLLIEALDAVCPVHCTQHIGEIKRRFPDKYLAGGAGRVLTL